jgi:signal transduction histidine kinase
VVRTSAPRVTEPDARAATDADLQAVALVPLTSYGRTGGVIGVWDRTALHPADPAGFDAADMEFLHSLGDLLALVLDQAGRFDALRASEHERTELRARVRHEERMAAVGEMASRAAQEVRNPIASVAAFARRAHNEMREDDPLREYVEIVMLEIERIGRIIGDQAALSDPVAPRLRVENLNAVVQRALQGEGEALVRRRIRLMKKLSSDLPPLLLDPERIERVVSNIVARALDVTPLGSRMRVETRRAGGYAVLEVSHDGHHDVGQMMEELFAPFAPGRESAGVGLGVARQIIHEHGGEVRVRSDAEWSTVLSLTLPILENDDRRRPGERRRPRGDRRRARETA